MTAINLQAFCRPEDKHYGRPFLFDGWAVATNRRILVAVRQEAVGAEIGEPNMNELTRGVLASLLATAAESAGSDAPRVFARDLVSNLPACIHCHGTGTGFCCDYCDECDGDGRFTHGSHEYECQECDGSGEVTYYEQNSSEPCPECLGTGRSAAHPTHGIGAHGMSVSAQFVALLAAHLPDAEICVNPTRGMFYVRSTRAGAIGAVSAIKLPGGAA